MSLIGSNPQGLDEEPQKTMVRFLKGLNPGIAVKIDLQSYQTFEDICKLAIKVEKHSKYKRPFTSSYSRPSNQAKPYSAPMAKALPE